MLKKLVTALVAASAFMLTTPVSASLSVGGYTFNDDAFADTLLSSSGIFQTSGGSLASVLTDTNAGTWAGSTSTGANVRMGFTDNTLVNSTGLDLILFELGLVGTFVVTIGGTTNSYLTAGTGFTAGGFNLNVAAINLDDFGFTLGQTIDEILIGMDSTAQGNPQPSLSLVGALNSRSVDNNVPEPASLVLLGLGLVGLGAMRRRKK